MVELVEEVITQARWPGEKVRKRETNATMAEIMRARW